MPGDNPISELKAIIRRDAVTQRDAIPPGERAQATQAAVAAALNSASERIEHVTRSLNQNRGESVGIG